MRVISGSARGIKLDMIEGLDTRPTTDRVKEAIFSMIQSRIHGARGLDLFAGSGALGIELLSRGARSITFVEQGPKQLSIIKSNLEKTRLDDGAVVLSKDVYNALGTFGPASFDIIMMDPPYLTGHVKACMDEIARFDLLSENGILVVEHAINDTEILNPPDYFESLKTKKYGKIGVTVFRRNQ